MGEPVRSVACEAVGDDVDHELWVVTLCGDEALRAFAEEGRLVHGSTIRGYARGFWGRFDVPINSNPPDHVVDDLRMKSRARLDGMKRP